MTVKYQDCQTLWESELKWKLISLSEFAIVKEKIIFHFRNYDKALIYIKNEVLLYLINQKLYHEHFSLLWKMIVEQNITVVEAMLTVINNLENVHNLLKILKI